MIPETLELHLQLPTKPPRPKPPAEIKVVRLRECPTDNALMEQPDAVFQFWTRHIATAPWFDPDKEALCVLMLNTRRRIIGFQLVTLGTLDTCYAHAREIFRPAIAVAAAAVILTHNHPSGDPTPSESDIKITRDMIRAGQLLKIEVLDHVIIGRQTPSDLSRKPYCSLRELGYFYT